jgi:hypothetical protein
MSLFMAGSSGDLSLNRHRPRVRQSIIFVLVILGVAGFAPALMTAPLLEEASGLTRIGDFLAVISDKEPGRYYLVPAPSIPAGAMLIDPARVRTIEWPSMAVALDLEGIAMLSDGRLVLLSERLRSLIDDSGVVVEYDNPLSEFGNRGLEGVAVRRLAEGASRIAVLWEGGYPEYHAVPPQLQEQVGRHPLRPQVWSHTLTAGTFRLRIKAREAEAVDLERIELKPPLPEGSAPDVQRFRATDLVWHRIDHADPDAWGFIVLLNSGNSPSTGAPVYAHQWLQKFSRTGDPIGPPIDLNQLVPDRLRHANWEGLAWLEEGSRLVLIHDVPPAGTPSLLIVTLPEGW